MGEGIERIACVLDTVLVVSTGVPPPFPPIPTPALPQFCSPAQCIGSACTPRKVSRQQLLKGREELRSGRPCTSHLSFHLQVPPAPTPVLLSFNISPHLISQGLSPYCSLNGSPTRQGARVRLRYLPRA